MCGEWLWRTLLLFAQTNTSFLTFFFLIDIRNTTLPYYNRNIPVIVMLRPFRIHSKKANNKLVEMMNNEFEIIENVVYSLPIHISVTMIWKKKQQHIFTNKIRKKILNFTEGSKISDKIQGNRIVANIHTFLWFSGVFFLFIFKLHSFIQTIF